MLDQVKGISSLMKYFVLICKLPSLENVSILDTPGFSSSRPDDTARTLAVINECDALFWVMDCNMGDVNQTSIDLIRNHLKKPLYIIVNKVDTISEQSAAMVEKQVGETLGKAGIKYEKIIRFSHQMPVSAIMEAVSQVRKIDMRELYPTQLKALLSDMCKTLSEEVSVLQSQSNAFWHAIMWTYKDFAESLSRLQDDCLEIIKLPQYNSRWLHEDNYVMSISEFERLGTILKNLAGDKVSGINDRCAGMIKYVEAYKRADEEYEKKYACLVNLLKSCEYLDALMNRLT
jgi:predicted GTPase